MVHTSAAEKVERLVGKWAAKKAASWGGRTVVSSVGWSVELMAVLMVAMTVDTMAASSESMWVDSSVV